MTAWILFQIPPTVKYLENYEKKETLWIIANYVNGLIYKKTASEKKKHTRAKET